MTHRHVGGDPEIAFARSGDKNYGSLMVQLDVEVPDDHPLRD